MYQEEFEDGPLVKQDERPSVLDLWLTRSKHLKRDIALQFAEAREKINAINPPEYCNVYGNRLAYRKICQPSVEKQPVYEEGPSAMQYKREITDHIALGTKYRDDDSGVRVHHGKCQSSFLKKQQPAEEGLQHKYQRKQSLKPKVADDFELEREYRDVEGNKLLRRGRDQIALKEKQKKADEEWIQLQLQKKRGLIREKAKYFVPDGEYRDDSGTVLYRRSKWQASPAEQQAAEEKLQLTKQCNEEEVAEHVALDTKYQDADRGVRVHHGKCRSSFVKKHVAEEGPQYKNQIKKSLKPKVARVPVVDTGHRDVNGNILLGLGRGQTVIAEKRAEEEWIQQQKELSLTGQKPKHFVPGREYRDVHGNVLSRLSKGEASPAEQNAAVEKLLRKKQSMKGEVAKDAPLDDGLRDIHGNVLCHRGKCPPSPEEQDEEKLQLKRWRVKRDAAKEPPADEEYRDNRGHVLCHRRKWQPSSEEQDEAEEKQCVKRDEAKEPPPDGEYRDVKGNVLPHHGTWQTSLEEQLPMKKQPVKRRVAKHPTSDAEFQGVEGHGLHRRGNREPPPEVGALVKLQLKKQRAKREVAIDPPADEEYRDMYGHVIHRRAKCQASPEKKPVAEEKLQLKKQRARKEVAIDPPADEEYRDIYGHVIHRRAKCQASPEEQQAAEEKLQLKKQRARREVAIDPPADEVYRDILGHVLHRRAKCQASPEEQQAAEEKLQLKKQRARREVAIDPPADEDYRDVQGHVLYHRAKCQASPEEQDGAEEKLQLKKQRVRREVAIDPPADEDYRDVQGHVLYHRAKCQASPEEEQPAEEKLQLKNQRVKRQGAIDPPADEDYRDVQGHVLYRRANCQACIVKNQQETEKKLLLRRHKMQCANLGTDENAPSDEDYRDVDGNKLHHHGTKDTLLVQQKQAKKKLVDLMPQAKDQCRVPRTHLTGQTQKVELKPLTVRGRRIALPGLPSPKALFKLPPLFKKK